MGVSNGGAPPARPLGGAYRVRPERNLREDNAVANRVALSGSEDRSTALACPLLQGQQISVTLKKFADGPTTINHKLGRRIRGWFIVRPGSVPIVLPSEVSSDDRQLVVQNPLAASFDVELWVY